MTSNENDRNGTGAHRDGFENGDPRICERHEIADGRASPSCGDCRLVTDGGKVRDGMDRSLRESRLDIVVTRGDGRDVFVKADDQVLLLDESEARILARELIDELDGDCDE